jgi:hypothetical protein
MKKLYILHHKAYKLKSISSMSIIIIITVFIYIGLIFENDIQYSI